MPSYKNMMEILVENKFDDIIDTFDCCQCKQCRDDIIAFSLNRLPPKYVVTREGEAYSKVYALGLQHDADIVSALTLGAKVVREHPRH